MRALRWFAMVLWVSGASYLWFRISPLAPDAVIPSESVQSLISISREGMIATCRVEEDDDSMTFTGPVSWYDRRTGRLIKRVLSERNRGIVGPLLPDRPRVARLAEDGVQVVADLWTGRTEARLPDKANAEAFDVSPDGRYLAWLDGEEVQIVERENGKLVLERPAVKLLGFLSNAIISLQVVETEAGRDRFRELALRLPDGTAATTDSPLERSPLLSSQGDFLLKRVDEFQAAVCDAQTGAVIWKTAVSFSDRPDSIRWNMYRFNAAGDELLAVYADDQRRPRFARWRAKDGQVISPLPTKLGALMEIHGLELDAVTGATTTRITTLSAYDNYEGEIVSSDGRYIVEPFESEWELIAWILYTKLDDFESSFKFFQRLQLSQLFDTFDQLPSQAVVDATTGERVGTVGVGNVVTPSDASWFAVQDHKEIRVYSAPFRMDWMRLIIWAFVPPIGLLIMTRLGGLLFHWKRRNG
ncbi:hypothetical protein AYO47_01150 [Planctomyces sp. SCGC AG-212-M04]|nr:hypothetical protein AYO47_01150 [Planctomyces sp. SCGC AG-212-M04]